MMMFKRVTLSAAALVMCFAMSSHAAQTIVIGDFEDGTTQGWFQNGTRPIAVVQYPDENGSFMLEVDWGGAGDFDWTLGLDNSGNPDLFLLANTVGPQVLEFDIYWDPPSDWTGDGWIQTPGMPGNLSLADVRTYLKQKTSSPGSVDASYRTR